MIRLFVSVGRPGKVVGLGYWQLPNGDSELPGGQVTGLGVGGVGNDGRSHKPELVLVVPGGQVRPGPTGGLGVPDVLSQEPVGLRRVPNGHLTAGEVLSHNPESDLVVPVGQVPEESGLVGLVVKSYLGVVVCTDCDSQIPEGPNLCPIGQLGFGSKGLIGFG